MRVSARSLVGGCVAALAILTIATYLGTDHNTQPTAEAPLTVTVDQVFDGDTFIASTKAAEDLGWVRVPGSTPPKVSEMGDRPNVRPKRQPRLQPSCCRAGACKSVMTPPMTAELFTADRQSTSTLTGRIQRVDAHAEACAAL